MTASLITLTSERLNDTPLKDHWNGSLEDAVDTSGGGTEDEIALINVKGFGQMSFVVSNLKAEAGSLKFYASNQPSIVLAADLLTNYRFALLGEAIAVDASAKKTYHFDACYSYILITFAKTGAGAESEQIMIDAEGTA